MSRRDAALLILLAALWGAVYPLTSLALRELSPAPVVLGRTALAALFLVPLAARRGALAGIRRQPAEVLKASLLQAALPLVLLTLGQTQVSSSLAGILAGLQPVFVALLSLPASEASPTRSRQLAGILLGMVGTVLLFAGNLTTSGTAGWAGGAIIASAALFALGAVYIHRALPGVEPLGMAAAAMTITAVALTPFATLAAPRFPGLATFGWLLLLGPVGTGVALVLFYSLIHRSGPTRAALAFYLAPCFALLFGATFLGEPATPSEVGGLGLILAGSVITATRRLR
jgi:drug/metabolite transporter (DMT)-like permease